MKRSITRTPWVEVSNKWLADPSGTIWEYGQYGNCYLCVRKNREGKFIPSVAGSTNIYTENWSFTNHKPMQFDMLEAAQKQCMDYVDKLRAEEKNEYSTKEYAFRVYLKAYSESPEKLY
jgi:hypothetical protein